MSDAKKPLPSEKENTKNTEAFLSGKQALPIKEKEKEKPLKLFSVTTKPVNIHCDCEKKNGSCTAEDYQKSGIWCYRCLGDWDISKARSEGIVKHFGWKNTTLHLIECYNDCEMTIQDGDNIHCLKCGGDPMLLEKDCEEPTKSFDAKTDLPNGIWDCYGDKCRVNFHETGMWCKACYGNYFASLAYMQYLFQRFSEGDTPEDLIQDVEQLNR